MRFLVLPLVLVAGLLAAADDPKPYTHEATGLVMPVKIGELPLLGSRDYGKEALGISVRYQVDKVYADIYLYHMDKKDLPSGIEAAVIVQEFERSAGELDAMQARGYYRDVAQVDPPELGELANFLHRSFTFKVVDRKTKKPGPAMQSHLLIRGCRGHYFKLRLSYPKASAEQGLAALAALAREMSELTKPEPDTL